MKAHHGMFRLPKVAAKATALLLVMAGIATLVPTQAGATTIYTSGSIRNCVTDGSISWRVCITQNYREEEIVTTFDDTIYIDVENYQVVWTQYDPTTAITGMEVLAGAGGADITTGKLLVDAVSQWNPTSVVSGKTYTYVPWWANQYVITNTSGVDYQCGRANSTLHHGSDSWALTSGNICQGALGFNPFA